MLKKIAVITATLFILVLLGAGGIFFYSSNPSFCRSCHIMEPFYQSWATSGITKSLVSSAISSRVWQEV